ncbi:unnamed protein product [Lymnaea stagnalis]|uniref:Galectin n=1 Tax=Lymnaea stagnalis TaxID=6523 RepID=A0AAV2H1Y7_LYMST
MASHVANLEPRGPGLFEASGPNVVLPCSAYLPSGLQVGAEILISGQTGPNYNSFSINLCSDRDLDHDTALHFNPRFSQGKVIRNHQKGGAWGGEETEGTLPFQRGQTFDVRIKVTQPGYQILVNNAPFCNFNHRLPVESVRCVFLTGEFSVSKVQVNTGQSFPGANPYQQQPFPGAPGANPYQQQPFPQGGNYQAPPYSGGQGYPGAPQQGAPIFNPPVPFTTAIPGGFYPGKMIFINGTPSQNAKRFTINLACGPTDQQDLALHFDVRISFGSDKNVVVRTHKKGGSWGPEERELTVFPFSPGATFELIILAEPDKIKVAVNNVHFTAYNNRIDLQQINHLQISGDISLGQVRFQ